MRLPKFLGTSYSTAYCLVQTQIIKTREGFCEEIPHSKGRMSKTLILVDPKDWAVSLEDPKMNTTECCQVCSISEDIIRAMTRLT